MLGRHGWLNRLCGGGLLIKSLGGGVLALVGQQRGA
jgi:hypothetical protein